MLGYVHSASPRKIGKVDVVPRCLELMSVERLLCVVAAIDEGPAIVFDDYLVESKTDRLSFPMKSSLRN